jgi:hypothetical protein
MKIPKSPEQPIPPSAVPVCCCRGAFVVEGHRYVATYCFSLLFMEQVYILRKAFGRCFLRKVKHRLA